MAPEALKEAVLLLRKAAQAVSGSHVVIIGGLAVQELGYERYTKDVDAVVDSDHFDEVRDYLRAHGFVLTPELLLRHRDTGAELDLLREGAVLKGSRLPLPHPRELGPHLGTASLAGLIRLKLDTPRIQDKADIVALMKTRLAESGRIGSELPEILREEFLKLVEQARRESSP